MWEILPFTPMSSKLQTCALHTFTETLKTLPRLDPLSHFISEFVMLKFGSALVM